MEMRWRKVEEDRRRETAQQRQRRGGPSSVPPPARSWERGKLSRVDRECFGLLSQEAQSIPQIV